MKFIPASVTSIFFCLILFSAEGRAQVDLSFGGTAWVNQWEPAWHDGRIKIRSINVDGKQLSDLLQNIHDFKSVWIPLYGPVISLNFFRRFSISSYFVYGKTIFRSDGVSRNAGLDYYARTPIISSAYREYKRDTVKMDSDTTIGFNVTEYLFLYAGYKYQSYTYRETSKSLYNFTEAIITSPQFKKNTNHGAGIGIGFNIHLYDALYIQVGISGVILSGREHSSKNYHANLTLATAGMVLPKNGEYLAYGGALVPTFAYRTPVNITLLLGFRVQLLRYRQMYNKQAYELFNNQLDLFYGLTFSAVYTISFDKKN